MGAIKAVNDDAHRLLLHQYSAQGKHPGCICFDNLAIQSSAAMVAVLPAATAVTRGPIGRRPVLPHQSMWRSSRQHATLSSRMQLRPNPPHPVNEGSRKPVSIVVQASYRSESGEEIPQAIVDAEEKSASGRQYRYLAYGVFGGLAGLLTLTRVGLNVIGMSPSSDFMQPSALGELLDIIVIGTSGLLWSQELTTQEANIQRIWEEVKRRKEDTGPKLVTMDDLRKQKKKSKKNRASRGFNKGPAVASASGSATAAPSSPAEAKEKKSADETSTGKQSSPVDETQAVEEAPAAGSGLFSGIKTAIDNANNTGRIQALQMNDSLEQAGVLPQTQQNKQSTSSSDDGDEEQ